jgi:steroid delta-isomerase
VSAAPRSAALARLIAFYESIAPDDLDRIADLYAPDATFKDPFNDVGDLGSIRRIFAHMFEQVESPRFEVSLAIEQGRDAMLVWEFRFAFRRPLPAGPRCIRGCTHVRFDDAGRVAWHRDYWDAAEELYAKLPVVGAVVLMLRRRGAAPAA